MPPKSWFFISYFSKKSKFLYLFICFVCTAFSTIFAQISLSFPTNRIVFQRNNDNFGYINILGNYTQSLDKIEARLTPVLVGQGIATDWVLVQEKPKAGYFAGRIGGNGGWYKLEIRAMKDNIVLKTITVEKVGIGEVFIALGQSNAQGIPNYGAKGASDDRVNTIDFQNRDVLNLLPENLNFVQLGQNVNVAPQGDGPWCYGELGDRLVKRFNVPVAFFNEGLLLVSVINWRESAEGKPTFNFVLDVGGRFQLPKGLPYVNLKSTLNYYGALMGVRSLLWIQGETDNSPNHLLSDTYAENLQKVIDISRQDFNENLTWMVARTSLTYLAPSNPEIIGGQNEIINKAGNNVFAGPFTDTLQVPRIDNVHFQNVESNEGISLLAENWDKALDSVFFKNSKPILAKSIIEPEIVCDTNNKVSLKIAEGFKSYEWSNNSNTNQITVDKGIFSVVVKDLRGNKLLTPSINTDFINPKEKPTIQNSGSLEFCTDGTNKIDLTANGQEYKTFVWSSGETIQKISVGTSGEFSVKGINEFGCVSTISDKIVVKTNPTPAQPKVTVLPANNVCEGQTITLTTESTDKVFWSNGDTTKTIKLEKVGKYDFSVKVSNKFLCISAPTILPKLSVFALPKQPSIAQIGLYSLQALDGNFIENDQFEWTKENVVFSKTSTPFLKISQNGSYAVKTIRSSKMSDNQAFTCLSLPSKSTVFQISTNIISLYPNPVSDLLYLETKETIRNIEVKLFTVDGKEIYKLRLDDKLERKEINLKILEKGNYIIRIKGDGFEESTRIVVE